MSSSHSHRTYIYIPRPPLFLTLSIPSLPPSLSVKTLLRSSRLDRYHPLRASSLRNTAPFQTAMYSGNTPEPPSPFNTFHVALAPALLKISLLLLTGLSTHLSLSPPNPPAPKKQCVAKKTLFERCILWVTFCSKVSRCHPMYRACFADLRSGSSR